ncbi:hypothetical protein CALVIDRAFT_557690 [Calocera viscosa TUFC12733]|uniref:Flavin reductase like domain-containing protein n=1 Tax=Calocera viscosa (strain TUFC12733) TaxID=1330018 RepID=A0A167I5C2_CALVF|nr:hypothetical protein CALVIDRAFT_557690 [Calocera viscosa TUFC12733]
MSEPLPPFDDSFVPTYTESPNAAWQFGDKVGGTAAGKEWIEGEKEGWTSIDPASVEPSKLYPLLISGIIPRPVAFVSSLSETGIENLAPFSFFNAVSFDPPTIMVSCTNKPRVKDTCHNIKTTKGFTVNIISEPLMENANVTAVNTPDHISEWDVSGLTKEKTVSQVADPPLRCLSSHQVVVEAPRVKESAFSMECELLEAIDIKNPETGISINVLIIGLVKYVHVRNDVLNERGVIDPIKFKPIARLGDIAYARLGDIFRLPRFSWDKEKEKMEEGVKRNQQL